MKMRKKIDRIHCQPHIGLTGKLLPDPASRFGGRATAKRISLDDHHLATATPGQVIGDATANHATSNNQHVRRSGQCLTHRCVSTTSCLLLSPWEKGTSMLIPFLIDELDHSCYQQYRGKSG